MTKFKIMTSDELSGKLRLSIGFSGDSGSGKTRSALEVAAGIAEARTGKKGAPFVAIDTEGGRLLHYRKLFPQMLYLNFSEESDDFSPANYVEAIKAVEAHGVTAGIIDSISHAHDGVGGYLDLQTMILEKLVEEADKRAQGRWQTDPAKFTDQAWARAKPEVRKLINAIVQSPIDWCVCTRAKKVQQDLKTKRNRFGSKLRRDDIPYDIVGSPELVFEMTAQVMLNPDNPGRPEWMIKCPDDLKTLFRRDQYITTDIGKKLVAWANDTGVAQDDVAVLMEARKAAGTGRESFGKWWKDNADKRDVAGTIIDELKGIVERVEAAKLVDAGANPLEKEADAQ